MFSDWSGAASVAYHCVTCNCGSLSIGPGGCARGRAGNRGRRGGAARVGGGDGGRRRRRGLLVRANDLSSTSAYHIYMSKRVAW